jgi:hypothetical protein
VFPRLANFNDILQLGFTNLCSGEFQLSTATDRFSFLQFLNLGLASRNEFGLMRCFILSFPLTLSPLRFFVVRLALVLQATKTLTYRSGGDTSLFIGSIVETRGSLLLKGNICVVLREQRLENHETRRKSMSCTYVHPLFLGLMSHAAKSQYTLDTEGIELRT